MSRTVEFYTPEQVAIQYELAGVGSRGAAAMLDGLLQLLIYLAILLIPYMLYELQVLPPWMNFSPDLLITLLVMGHIFLVAGYHVFFETLWNGETPGKRWMGLRVIKDGGYPVDFRAVVIRNLVRIADILPTFYGLGLVVSLVHKRYQRLGDLAGGTLVVTHGHEKKLHELTMGDAQVFRLLDASVLSQLSRLSREEYRLVQRFLERRGELPAGLQAEFTQRLAQQLIAKFGYQPPELGMDALRWLEELDLAFRRRALGIVSEEPSSGAPTPAPVQSAQPAPSAASDGRKW